MSAEISDTKIMVLEPSLTHLRGHHLTGVLELKEALSPVRPVVIVNVRTDLSALPDELTVHALFEHTNHQKRLLTPRGPRVLRPLVRELHRFGRRMRAGALTLADYTVDQLPAAMPTKVGARRWLAHVSPREWPELATIAERTSLLAADHIVVPTAEPCLIRELLEMFRVRAAHRPRVHARFIDIGGAERGRDFKRLFAWIAGFPELDGRLHIYVETVAMQRYFIRHHNRQPDLFPHVLTAPPVMKRRAPTTGPIVFGCLGSARREKGFDRLPAILRGVVTAPSFDRRRLTLVVQGSNSRKKVEGLIGRLMDEASALGVNVELHKESLTPAQYAALLDRIDCFLLPYAKDRYWLSGSGILSEALLHAKPFICSAGLSFGDYARDGNAIEAANNQEFASAILKMTADPEPFFAAAWESALAYRTFLEDNALLRRLRTRPAQVAA